MYDKNELNKLTLVNYDQYPNLEVNGENDENGYQIFTPRFIVDDIINMIGYDSISNIYKTVLEPTSGDGAFTVRILELRLKRIFETEPIDYLHKSLIALSTIYSIEMDQELLVKQRNNLFTLLNYFAKKNNIKLNKKYKELAEIIIKENIVWGETNTMISSFYSKKQGLIIGWYMPTTIKYIEKTKEVKKIKIQNLFGEIEELIVETNNKTNKIKKKDNRTQSNRIKFSKWVITKDLEYTKVIEPIRNERDKNEEY